MKVRLRLKEVRKSRGLSQNKLAQALSMTLQNVQRLEYGEAKGIQFDTLGKLCEVLNCKVEELIMLEPETPDPKAQPEPAVESEKKLSSKATKRSRSKTTTETKLIQFPNWKVG